MNLVTFFKALGDETRLRIINLLLHRSPLRVMDMVTTLKLPQSTVSRHLALLKNAEWVDDRRVDKWVYYRLSSRVNTQFKEALKSLFESSLTLKNDIKNFDI